MTNDERRENGELYDANHNLELTRRMDICKDKCWEYNRIRPSDWKAKNAKLREIIGHVSDGVRILAPFWCDYGTNITLGENFYANHGLVILDAAKVVFGKNVFVAPNCGFHTAGHPLDIEQRRKGLEFARPITVGDDVWFGAGAQVLPGVTIGMGAIIGAGAVVTRDVPPRTIVAGVPARVLCHKGNDFLPRHEFAGACPRTSAP